VPHTALSFAGRRSIRLTLASACVALTAAALPAGASAQDMARASGPSDTGGPRVYTATNSSKLFYDHSRRLQFSYRVAHPQPVTAKVTVVKPGSGEVLKRWVETVRNDDVQTVSWNGTVGGNLQKERNYAFRVVARDAGGAETYSASSRDTERDSFKLWHQRFPVRGKHQYGDGFGAGRGHQGTDVFANCGNRLEAARGGRVQYAGYHSSAGNYLVIDLKGSRKDFAYMHLLRRPRVQDGDRVKTGQLIGKVGESGNASGCHLHFEIWSKPGWYEGGSATDSEDDLRRWDRYS
jgi:murein DD-endopeptidase MepM/ murein hydrolase activator NlpD